MNSDEKGRESQLLKHAPYCWANELLKLSNKEKKLFGKKRFVNEVQKIYSARCQHSEARNIICDNCQSSRNAYQRSSYNGMSNKDIFEITSSCTSVLKRRNGIWTEIGLAEACSNSILVQALPNQNISLDNYIPRLSYKDYIPQINRRLRALINLDSLSSSDLD